MEEASHALIPNSALLRESDRDVIAIRFKPIPPDDQSLESVFEGELYLAFG